VDRSDKQNENFKQTLSQIGGIDDIIEEIEEIVQNVTSSQKCLEGRIKNETFPLFFSFFKYMIN